MWGTILYFFWDGFSVAGVVITYPDRCEFTVQPQRMEYTPPGQRMEFGAR